MGIGKRIKEARERLGLTQNELGELIGVTGSAITNYEKETSHPKEPVMYKLFEALHVDANYLFQDVVNIPSKENDVTLAEYDHIKKYRGLDDHGREHVNNVLEWETTRVQSLEEKNIRISELETTLSSVKPKPEHVPIKNIRQKSEPQEFKTKDGKVITDEDAELLVARNGKPMSVEDKKRLIQLLDGIE